MTELAVTKNHQLEQALQLRAGLAFALLVGSQTSGIVHAQITRMLQQDNPERLCPCPCVQFSVRQFIQWAAAELDMQIIWQADEVEEVGLSINTSSTGEPRPTIRIDPCYFRPTEVESLLAHASKAKQRLGWLTEITAQEKCKEMDSRVLAQAKQHALLKYNCYKVNVSVE